MHIVRDVRQIEVHTAEPLVSGPIHFEVEIAIARLKKYKSPGSDQIPAELIQAGGDILLCVIHNSLILFGIRKICLISGRSLLLYRVQQARYGNCHMKKVASLPHPVPVDKKGDETDCNRGISMLSNSNKILSNILLSSLIAYIMKLLGIISVGFDVTDQLLIRFSASSDTGEKMGVQ
jgi:hypothetical protein